jgi:sugar phosphate isomerase/epimerase
LGGHCRLLKDNSINNFNKVLDLAESLGVKYVSTDTGEIEEEEDKEKFFREIRKIGEYAAPKNISICIEMHGDWFNSGKKGSEIIKDIDLDNVKINYDTGNVIFFNDTRPEDDIKYALPFLGFIHLKDSSGKYKDWDFPTIGEGAINFEKIFNSIKDYKGPISLEIEFDGKKQPLEKISDGLKKSMEYLKGYGFHNF